MNNECDVTHVCAARFLPISGHKALSMGQGVGVYPSFPHSRSFMSLCIPRPPVRYVQLAGSPRGGVIAVLGRRLVAERWGGGGVRLRGKICAGVDRKSDCGCLYRIADTHMGENLRLFLGSLRPELVFSHDIWVVPYEVFLSLALHGGALSEEIYETSVGQRLKQNINGQRLTCHLGWLER